MTGSQEFVNTPKPDVFGAIDGVEEPVNKMEEMKRYLEPLKVQYGKYVQLRGWREFMVMSMTIPKKEEIYPNVERNLQLYKGNYLVILTVLLILTILTTPWCLLTVLFLALGWGGFLRKNEDPEWQVEIGGVSVDKRKRVMGMGAITSIIVIVFLGSTLASVIFCSGFLAVVHAFLHKVPEDVTDDVSSDVETEV